MGKMDQKTKKTHVYPSQIRPTQIGSPNRATRFLLRVPRPRVCLSSVWCVPPRTHLPDRGVTRNKRQVTCRQTKSCCRRVILCIPDKGYLSAEGNTKCEEHGRTSRDRSSGDSSLHFPNTPGTPPPFPTPWTFPRTAA